MGLKALGIVTVGCFLSVAGAAFAQPSDEYETYSPEQMLEYVLSLVRQNQQDTPEFKAVVEFLDHKITDETHFSDDIEPWMKPFNVVCRYFSESTRAVLVQRVELLLRDDLSSGHLLPAESLHESCYMLRNLHYSRISIAEFVSQWILARNLEESSMTPLLCSRLMWHVGRLGEHAGPATLKMFTFINRAYFDDPQSVLEIPPTDIAAYVWLFRSYLQGEIQGRWMNLIRQAYGIGDDKLDLSGSKASVSDLLAVCCSLHELGDKSARRHLGSIMLSNDQWQSLPIRVLNQAGIILSDGRENPALQRLAEYVTEHYLNDDERIYVVTPLQWEQLAYYTVVRGARHYQDVWAQRLRSCFFETTQGADHLMPGGVMRMAKALSHLSNTQSQDALVIQYLDTAQAWKHSEPSELVRLSKALEKLGADGLAARRMIASHLTDEVVCLEPQVGRSALKYWWPMVDTVASILSDADKRQWVAAFIQDGVSGPTALQAMTLQEQRAFVGVLQELDCPLLAEGLRSEIDWATAPFRVGPRPAEAAGFWWNALIARYQSAGDDHRSALWAEGVEELRVSGVGFPLACADSLTSCLAAGDDLRVLLNGVLSVGGYDQPATVKLQRMQRLMELEQLLKDSPARLNDAVSRVYSLEAQHPQEAIIQYDHLLNEFEEYPDIQCCLKWLQVSLALDLGMVRQGEVLVHAAELNAEASIRDEITYDFALQSLLMEMAGSHPAAKVWRDRLDGMQGEAGLLSPGTFAGIDALKDTASDLNYPLLLDDLLCLAPAVESMAQINARRLQEAVEGGKTQRALAASRLQIALLSAHESGPCDAIAAHLEMAALLDESGRQAELAWLQGLLGVTRVEADRPSQWIDASLREAAVRAAALAPEGSRRRAWLKILIDGNSAETVGAVDVLATHFMDAADSESARADLAAASVISAGDFGDNRYTQSLSLLAEGTGRNQAERLAKMRRELLLGWGRLMLEQDMAPIALDLWALAYTDVDETVEVMPDTQKVVNLLMQQEEEKAIASIAALVSRLPASANEAMRSHAVDYLFGLRRYQSMLDLMAAMAEASGGRSLSRSMDEELKRAHALIQLQRTDEAQNLLESIANMPGSPGQYSQVLYYQGCAHLQVGDSDAACTCFEQLVKQYPRTASSTKARRILERLGVVVDG